VYLKKYRYILITFAATLLISFGLVYLLVDSLYSHQVEKKPWNNNENNNFSSSQPVGVISLDTRINELIYYKKCRHLLIREDVQNEYLNDGVDLETLKVQGWTVIHDGDKKISLFKELEQLCPDCAEKRHLGPAGENVAIFEGPVGVPGKRLEVLNIKINSLPPEWQEKVRKGTLGFSSEQELLEALDSIDEYQ